MAHPSLRISYPVSVANVITYAHILFILVGTVSESVAVMQRQMAALNTLPFNQQSVVGTISWEHLDSTTLLMVCQAFFENYFLGGSR